MTKPVNELSTKAAEIRLQQLVSQGLPIGSFTYSQGLEWAIEVGWVTDQSSLKNWLRDLLDTGIAQLEVPIYKRLRNAIAQQDLTSVLFWTTEFLAHRETEELRLEEQQRGRAFARLLPAFEIEPGPDWLAVLQQSQLGGFAYATERWHICHETALRAYIWSWLESIAIAGVRLIPLGQTAGQQIIYQLADAIVEAVTLGSEVKDDAIGYSCFAQAIASSNHATQYTRLYRS